MVHDQESRSSVTAEGKSTNATNPVPEASELWTCESPSRLTIRLRQQALGSQLVVFGRRLSASDRRWNGVARCRVSALADSKCRKVSVPPLLSD